MAGRPEADGLTPAARLLCRVLRAWLLIVHGEDAPEVLRRMADELEWLEAERVAESAGADLDPPN